MKDSYVFRLPYKEKDWFTDNYSLSEKDIAALKSLAKKEGRSLRTFVTYKLKEIASPELFLVSLKKEEK